MDGEKSEKPKVQILSEREYQIREEPPPNFVPWFACCEKRDKV